MTSRRLVVAAALVCGSLATPALARADDALVELARQQVRPRGSRDPVLTFAAGALVLVASAVAARAEISRAAPLSFVEIAWPTAAADAAGTPRSPTWTRSNGRRPMLFATLVDLRF